MAEKALLAMGFERSRVREALAIYGEDQESCCSWLLEQADAVAPSVPPAPSALPVAHDSAIARKLIDMGFDAELTGRALDACGSNIEAATNWLLGHAPPAPLAPSTSGAQGGDAVAQLIALGYEPRRARQAVRVRGDDLADALQWLADEHADMKGRDGDRSRGALPPSKQRKLDDASSTHGGRRDGVAAKAAYAPAAESSAPVAYRSLAKASVVLPARTAVNAAPQAGDVCGGASGSGGRGGAGRGGASSPPVPLRVSSTPRSTASSAGDGRSLKRLLKECAQLQSETRCASDTQASAHERAHIAHVSARTRRRRTDARTLASLLADAAARCWRPVALGARGGCRQLHGFEAAPLDESDLYYWEARLYDFAPDDPLAADLAARRVDALVLRIHFPTDYPNA